jgi:hypothetical protein
MTVKPAEQDGPGECGPEAIEEAELLDLVTLLRRIPDEFRDLRIGHDRAVAEFAVGVRLQQSLIELGFPHTDTAQGPLFDSTDLLNVSLSLDIGSRQRRVMAWWIRELGRPAQGVARYRLDYVATCPERARAGPCHFRLFVPDSSWLDRASHTKESQVLHSAEFALPSSVPEFPSPIVELLDECRAIRFLRLPNPLRWDVGFIRVRGVGDCAGVARLLVEEGTARGMTVRFSYGRSLTPPFSASHFWAEFLVEGVWVPVDPVLIEAFKGWRLISHQEWVGPPSLGRILGRIGDSKHELVSHDGVALTARFPTYRIA